MKLSFGALVASCLFVLLSCQKNPTNSLVAHMVAEPDDMHPVNGASAVRAEIQLYTQMSLLRLDYATGKLMPCLAVSLPTVSGNGLAYTYELKQEARWDDQQPITARDVIFTTKASKCLLTNNPAVKSFWENVEDIRADAGNSRRFTVLMKRRYILNDWFWTDFPIIQEAFYDSSKVLATYSCQQLADSTFLKGQADIEAWANSFNSPERYTNPAFISGAVPYRIARWDKGQSLSLEKKKGHWTEGCQDTWFCQARPDKIIFKLNSNNASTMLELRNRLIDISTQVDFSTFTELSRDAAFQKDYSTQLANTYNYLYICMNMQPASHKRPPLFNDLLTRRAMAMLTPYDEINKTVYENNMSRITGPVAASKQDFNTALKAVPYDLENAKALLAQAGWADTDNDDILDKVIDGKKVKLEFDINFMNTQKQWEDIAKHLAASLQKAKIFARLNPLDYSSFVNACLQHDFDMSIGAWQGSSQPEDFTQLWSTASWKNNGLNFSGFGNAATDALIDSINTAPDEATRIACSRRFQKLVYDGQPYVFLFSQRRRVVIARKWGKPEVYAEHPGVLLNTLTLNP